MDLLFGLISKAICLSGEGSLSVRGVVYREVWFHGWQQGTHLGQCSRLRMDSLSDINIGDADARNLGAALRVNTTLTELK